MNIKNISNSNLNWGIEFNTPIVISCPCSAESRDQMIETARNMMTKALNSMNIKQNMVLSDITSKSGLEVIAAINSGERLPEKLIKHVHYRVKASKEDLLKALEGSWREEREPF